MNHDHARTVVLDALARTAPELDLTHLDPRAELTVEADLDSMGFLSLVTSVAERTGHDIPEGDYPRLVTLDAFTDYLTDLSRESDHTPRTR